MKREGRQHGMVRSCLILPSPTNSRVVNRVDESPAAGVYTKVSRKPSNHSKFTGKCGKPRCLGCHTHPVCKSKSKAKGTQKLKSCDVANNHQLIAWRVVDKAFGAGKSATGLLWNMSSIDYLDDEVEQDDVYYESLKPELLSRIDVEEDDFSVVGEVEDEDWFMV